VEKIYTSRKLSTTAVDNLSTGKCPVDKCGKPVDKMGKPVDNLWINSFSL
jgi:hypothetical protein